MEMSETILRYVLDECVIFVVDDRPSQRLILDNSLFKNDMPKEHWDYLIQVIESMRQAKQEYRS